MTNRIKAILTALLTLMMMSAMCATAAAEGGVIIPEHLNGSEYAVPAPGGVQAMSTISTWDWREEGGVTPIKFQASCGACWVFGTMAMVEGNIKAINGTEYDLSEEHAKECNWESLHGINPCDGGYTDQVINVFTRDGMVMEDIAGYHSTWRGCNQSWTPALRMTGWNLISVGTADTDVLKNYIYNYGPVVSTMDGSCLDAYYGGVITQHGFRTSHIVSIVGWNDTMPHDIGQGAWIVKNSWGDWWGDDGYFYVAYGRANIAKHTSVMSGYEDYDPTIDTVSYDEAGWNYAVGYMVDETTYQTDAWALCKFNTTPGEEVTNIEFWTTGSADVNLYLYEGFDGTSLTDLVYTSEGHFFAEPGYHSIVIDSPMVVNSDEIVVVAYFNNHNSVYWDHYYPVATDHVGQHENEMTYTSPNGSSGSWDETWNEYKGYQDVALRLRILQAPCERYDFDDSGTISMAEAWAAIQDYQAGIISMDTAWTVVVCYQEDNA